MAEPVRQQMLSSGVPLLAEFAEHAGVAEGRPGEPALTPVRADDERNEAIG